MTRPEGGTGDVSGGVYGLGGRGCCGDGFCERWW